MGVSVRQYLSNQTERILSIYPSEESKEIIYRLAEHFLGVNRPNLLLMLDRPSSIFNNDFERLVRRLLDGEPLQYIMGEVEFYGCPIRVTPDVLIPRPETEELVHMVVKEWKDRPVALIDFGTGSGCIPIALAKSLKSSTITTVDISSGALVLAQQNAAINGVSISFIHADMRTFASGQRYDIIVSNPPYVMSSEKMQMRDNVLKHEPHLALFVEDDNPLEFYVAIADFAASNLNDGGAVYLEINQQLGAETAELFTARGLEAEVRKDLFDVDRFVVARWKR